MITEYFYDTPNYKRLMFMKGEHITVAFHDILRSMTYTIIENYADPEIE